MKTRSPDTAQQSGLPPPPAPTARDANPWPMTAPPQAKQQVRLHPRAPGRTGGPRTPESAARPRERRLRWLPLAILVFVAGAGVQQAIKALGEGDVESGIGALVIVAVVAFIFVRRLTRKN